MFKFPDVLRPSRESRDDLVHRVNSDNFVNYFSKNINKFVFGASLLGLVSLNACDDEPVVPTPKPDPKPPIVVADSITLEGIVDNDKFGLYPKTTVLLKQNKDTLGFGVTDKNGLYSLVIKKGSGNYEAVFESEGHKTVIEQLSEWKSKKLDVTLPVLSQIKMINYELQANSIQTNNPIQNAEVKVRGVDNDSLLLEGFTDNNGKFSGEYGIMIWAFDRDTVNNVNDLESLVYANNFHDLKIKNKGTQNVQVNARLAQKAKSPGAQGTTIKLYNIESGLQQAGFVIMNNDTISAPQGELELYIPNNFSSIETRLANPYNGMPWGFIRTTKLSEINEDNVLVTYGIDFYLRDLNKNIIDSLYIEGYSPFQNEDTRNMSPKRFQDFMKHTHFEAQVALYDENKIFIGMKQHDDKLARWSSSKNKFTPDALIIYREKLVNEYVNEEWVTRSYTLSNKMEEMIIEAYKEQIEIFLFEQNPLYDGIINPNSLNPIPIIIKDKLDNTGRYHYLQLPENHNIQHVAPTNFPKEYKQNAGISVSATTSGEVFASEAIFQSNPDTQNTDIGKKSTVWHELFSSLIYGALPRIFLTDYEIARGDETILATHGRGLLPTKYDRKAGRIIKFRLFESGESHTMIIGLPITEHYK